MLRFKPDENADQRWRIPLKEAGNEVSTVAEEQLQGTDDQTLAAVCRDQGLSIVTADIDFAQTIKYPPQNYRGLIILHHPKPTLAGMLGLIRQIAVAIKHESPVGRLWIVEPGRIRVHGSPER
ncbi:MAG TPA: DUF5615 family PIN-like protein [Candidatus Hydrogenedentes bacterium]|nr:DUF5615 family PIN-like protein [Candidatus Hydrogenedentota bacterium]HNT88497.1 DUF5615 family PIN-like protein [Candidatus Hydrogenedentota bacterium]